MRRRGIFGKFIATALGALAVSKNSNADLVRSAGDFEAVGASARPNTTPLSAMGNGNANLIDYSLIEKSTESRLLSEWMRDWIKVTDFMTEAEVQDARSCSLTLDLTQSLRAAFLYCSNLKRPVSLFFPPGKYKISAPLILNSDSSASNIVKNIVLVGQEGHRSYDSGDELPASLVGFGVIDCILDLRKCSQWAVIGLGLVAPASANAVVRCGTQERSSGNQQIVRVGSILNCLLYGANIGVDAYLTSGLRIIASNISRARTNGIRLNACGDWEVMGCTINNCGSFLHAIEEPNYYSGAALVAYGGGGNNNYSGGKVEVNSKGLLFDNVQGVNISGVQFDKNREFALGVGGNSDTKGKTQGLGYQPRSFSVSNCRFVSSGWDSKYKSHICLTNSGVDLDLNISLVGNSFAVGGPDAIDLKTNSRDVFGVGPERIVRISNSSNGSNAVKVASSGNLYLGGASRNTLESYDPRVIFDSAGDLFDLPCIMRGEKSFLFGVSRRLSFKFAWTPGVVGKLQNKSVLLDSVKSTFARDFNVVPPHRASGLLSFVEGRSEGVFLVVENLGLNDVEAPKGDYLIEYTLDAWRSVS